MQDPAFQLRVARNGESKVWVQLNGALVELPALFQLVQILKSGGEIMCLDKSEIGLAVIRRLAFHSRLFRGRQFGLERVGDFLGEVGLDRDHIGYIVFVVAGPNMLVTVRVDRLLVLARRVAGATGAG